MKILFCTRHFGYVRNFESAVELLAERGHRVHLAADRPEASGGAELVARLAARYPSISHGWTPGRERDEWLTFATKVRLSHDYLRYLDHRYDRAPKIRQRAKERTPAPIVWLVESAGFRYRPGRLALRILLRLTERALPWNPEIDRFLREQAPDVVLLTPLVDLGSPQLDLLKSARALGLKTLLCVGSWDHLSTKALIWIPPDRITVWNDTQRRELTELHGLPADLVSVTGAQCYDQWFDRQPSRTREAFCRDVGLPADRPFVLYVCSSLFRGGPAEAEFAETWVRAVRASQYPHLRDVGILMRPHPTRLGEWEGRDLSALPHVAFRGSNPIDDQAKDDYFDSLYYSAAVVGLNTSAFLEAAIVGRPVFTVLHKDYWKSQEGTLHFHYLLDVEGGMLRTAMSLEAHLAQLADLLAGGGPSEPTNRRFVQAFLRPHGLEAPATPHLVEVIEELAAAGSVKPRKPPLWAPLVRLVLHPLANPKRWKEAPRRVKHGLHHAGRKTTLYLQKRTRTGLKRYVRSPLRDATRRVIPRRDVLRPLVGASFEGLEEVQAVKEAITRLGRSKVPILLGPWLSEAGFELLYWIPFLEWAKTYGNLRPDRLVAVSRGGAARWYRHVAAQYRDIFEFFDPGEFRIQNEQRVLSQGGQKHTAVTNLDEEILDRVKRSLGLRNAAVIHPSLMYRLFLLFWQERVSLDLVQGFIRPRLLRVDPNEPLPPGVPDEYVAVKFYSNRALPSTPDNAGFIADLIRQLSERHHVVMLNTGMQFDDHVEFPAVLRERIHYVDRFMTATTNLDVQTTLIARARALVGTYGGFAYLGPLCGVDTLTLYSDATGFRSDHLELAKRVFQQLEGGSFVALHRRDLAVLSVGLGHEATRHAGAGTTPAS